MSLKAYEEFAEEPLAFPIGGKVYTVPPLGFEDGIRLQRVLAGDDTSLNGLPVEEGWKLVLGTAWDEMVTDKVPMEALSRAGLAGVADFQYGRKMAETVWEADVSPEALAAAVAANQNSSPGTRPSHSTALGNRTQRRAASKRTTSPTTSKAKAKASQS